MKKIIFLLAMSALYTGLFLSSSSIFGQANCNDLDACNYDPLATGSDECLYSGDPCDDLNGSTLNDAYDSKCDCLGELVVPADFTLQDPCNCFNPGNIDLDDDGTIDLLIETIVITANSGQTWSLSSGNGILDASGNPISSIMATESSTGIYTATFYHAPTAGYFSSWSNGTNTLVIFNTCDACSNVAGVPTMSTWGLLLLALMSMTYLLLYSVVGQNKLALAKSNGQSYFNFKNIKSYPFDKEVFNKMALLTIGAIVLIGALTLFIYGTISPVDVFGFAITAPIFTYFIHLLVLAQD